MRELTALREVLDRAKADAAVLALQPDDRALLLAVDGIEPGPGDDVSEKLLQRAEACAREVLSARPVEELPHVAAWREAYRAFGAKPQRTRNSLDPLLRRAETELPRINRQSCVYNVISVLHQVPLGGKDLDCHVGPPRLMRATGPEPFDTTAGGQSLMSTPTRERSCGATTPESPASAGTGGRPSVRS